MRIQDLAAQFDTSRLENLKPKVDGGENSDDFANTLMDVLKEVNESQLNARDKQNAFMTGQNVDLSDVMIAAERAGIAMQLTMQVRNKLLEAYQEIARTQI
ncbi:MAG: flagellar hook-basal body complex protein FliE [Fimbriimonadaceae bacterium]|nr:flagellar hook-basal body complex protein FliE [Fimbriimonadaceae bacterium]